MQCCFCCESSMPVEAILYIGLGTNSVELSLTSAIHQDSGGNHGKHFWEQTTREKSWFDIIWMGYERDKERSNGQKHRNALKNVSLRTFKNNMLKDASMHLQALVVVVVHRLQTGQVVAAQASSEWDDAAPRAHSLWRSKMLRISWCLTALFVDQVHPGMS